MTDLESALLGWLRNPVVNLVVSPSEELINLRERVDKLQAEMETHKRERERVERLFWEEYKHYSTLEQENDNLKEQVKKLEKERWSKHG